MVIKRLVSVLLLLLIIFQIHHFQRKVDHIRLYEQSNETLYFLPQPEVMHTMSMGYHHLSAEIMWVRSILLYSDFVLSCKESESEWLLSTLRAVKYLDPEWRSVYFWGGTMLSLCKHIDGSDELFIAGSAQFPDDAFFPFSVAMNALLERNDTELALDWMQRAANKDTAPPWYKAAVGGLLKEGQGQDASIRYLEEQLKDENLRPNVRSLTEYRLNLLRHEMAQSQLEHLRDQWRDTHEEPLDDLNMLGDIPSDPFGVGWVQSGDGRIRSGLLEAQEAKRVVEQETSWLMRKDWGQQ